MSIAVFPGSFDPITLGHLDLIKRASKLFDKLYVCVMVNSGKQPMFTSDERVALIDRLIADMPNVSVDMSRELVVKYARDVGADVIVKGLRAGSDFDREHQMALINKTIDADIDTVFLTASEGYSHISSTVVREMARYGVPLDAFAPAEIIDDINSKAEKWR